MRISLQATATEAHESAAGTCAGWQTAGAPARCNDAVKAVRQAVPQSVPNCLAPSASEETRPTMALECSVHKHDMHSGNAAHSSWHGKRWLWQSWEGCSPLRCLTDQKTRRLGHQCNRPGPSLAGSWQQASLQARVRLLMSPFVC